MLSLPLFGIAFLAALTRAQNATSKKCYSLDGQELDETYKPCNPNAEFSACCALNGTDPGNNDICLDSGLCQSTSGWYAGFLWANGCTDSTGKADACPRVCAGMPTQYSFNVLQCNPGEFCCRAGYEKGNCCNQTQNMIETSHIGSLLLPGTSEVVNTSYYAPVSSPSNDSSSIDNFIPCPADHTAVVGGALGGVLGAALIASLIALALALRTRKTLQSEVAQIKGQRDAALQQSADEKTALQQHFQQQMQQQQQHQMQTMAAPTYQASPQYGYLPSPPFGGTYQSQALPMSPHQHAGMLSPPSEIGTLPRPVELETQRNPSELSDGVEDVKESLKK